MTKTYVDFKDYRQHYPDAQGYFGEYGGALLPPELVPVFQSIAEAYHEIAQTEEFIQELHQIQRDFQGRPTPVYHCKRLSDHLGALQIYLKREDLNHSGAHKLNHCMGEGLLARYLGKQKLIAETGAGQHGVALATAAAYFGLACDIYMGEQDMQKQYPNVVRMQLLGARVIPVTEGQRGLKEAVDAAFVAYQQEHETAIYCIGSVVGPHPFPLMVRDFQSVVGYEAQAQFLQQTGQLPDTVCASVGGGSNSIGLFQAFLDQPVQLVGVEPLGRGPSDGDHAASIRYGRKGSLHGFESFILLDAAGQALPVHSVASGLDYPAVGPEHAYLNSCGRVEYDAVSDEEAIEAFFLLCRYEGIIPAIESAHGLAYAIRQARAGVTGSILVNLSGRGDKDIDYIHEQYGTGEAFFADEA